eukprot:598715-Pelagomonas_calceolata.AAC.1
MPHCVQIVSQIGSQRTLATPHYLRTHFHLVLPIPAQDSLIHHHHHHSVDFFQYGRLSIALKFSRPTTAVPTSA